MIEERDCRKCSKLNLSKGCIGKEWFSYADIRWCRFQCIWLLIPDNLLTLGEGNWPDNPIGSSYVDLPITSRSFRNEAYFEKPSGMVAEIMTRLNKTGEDGQTLMEDIHFGIRRYEDLKSVAKRALNYISGFRRRKESYRSFKSRTKSTNVGFQKKGGK